uniref:Transcriptional coactivator p15 (PC4) C-terminal domain-containing protein n=1 Tax=Euplotes harpa TaxID=151035 RepID=A0A7S3JNX5_9SPIT|mmetsp:Transcript_7540/g.8512  ORF Transcript_7540/g.8512 Transcript_7540/m.8512 type:complete len:156 (+) Transcript_7540:38-505(+)
MESTKQPVEFTEEDQKLLDKLIRRSEKKKHKKDKSRQDGEKADKHPSKANKRDKKDKVKQEEDKQEAEKANTAKRTLKAKPKSTFQKPQHMFDITTRKKASVSVFKGKKMIDFREYFEKDNEFLPTKKGIALNEEAWNALKEAIPKIDQAVKKLT